MKRKLFTLILSITMLATCILPTTSANAQGKANPSSDDIPGITITDSKEVSDYVKDIACQAFPEYESKIRANHIVLPSSVKAQTMNTNEIVVQEQRAISDTEMITYTEYSNGISMLAGTYTTGKNVTNKEVTGPATVYTFNAWLQVLGSYDTMLIEDIVLGTAPNYSRFVSFGTVSPASSNTPTRGDYRETGTLGINGSAYVEYMSGFNIKIVVPTGEHNIVRYATMKIYADNNMQIAFSCY